MPTSAEKEGIGPPFRHRLIGLTGTNGAGKGEVAAYLITKGMPRLASTRSGRAEEQGMKVTRDS
jgi:dephospho-CoA kinase